MFKDLLLPLPVQADIAVSAKAMSRALEAAKLLEARVTALALEPQLAVPAAFGADRTHVGTIIKAQRAALHKAAQETLDAFGEAARETGLSYRAELVSLADTVSFHPVVVQARLRDLAILPFVPGDGAWEYLAQSLIFDSGRPILVMPQGDAPFRFDRIVVAWDFSRAAARAVGDALPLLRRAIEVCVVVAGKDKSLPNAPVEDLVTRLACNGVKATVEAIEPAGRTIGETLDEAAASADLLVMGGFGHSRARDFFLGGATKHVLRKPSRPTFLSH
jgi:nucleotide-binding universal stress UspA family protein